MVPAAIPSPYNIGMASNPREDEDVNQAAHRVVKDATGGDRPLPADLEQAWAEWSRSIQNVDERGMTLLRAAFEAGYSAGSSSIGSSNSGE